MQRGHMSTHNNMRFFVIYYAVCLLSNSVQAITHFKNFRTNKTAMRKIEVIVRSERMPVVKEHLRQIGIDGMTISTVSGWSKQREHHL